MPLSKEADRKRKQAERVQPMSNLNDCAVSNLTAEDIFIHAYYPAYMVYQEYENPSDTY